MRNDAPWIVAIAAVALSAALLYSESKAMEDDAATWRSEQDSLQAQFDRKSFQFDSLMLHTDSIRHYADSVRANRVHDTVYIPTVWRRVKLMDINAKMDSLKSL